MEGRIRLDRPEIPEFNHGTEFAVEAAIGALVAMAHGNATAKGWWELSDRLEQAVALDPELAEFTQVTLISSKLDLMHSELAEATEGIRHGNGPSGHIPAFSCLEEELADVFIRGFDLAGKLKLRLAQAIIAKMKFNATRSVRHGGKKI